MSLERKIESSISLCIPQDLNILGKSCTTFVIVKIVRNLSRGRSPCQRVNHVKSGVIYFSAFIFSYDTIHVSGTIHTWNRDLTIIPTLLKKTHNTLNTSNPKNIPYIYNYHKSEIGPYLNRAHRLRHIRRLKSLKKSMVLYRKTFHLKSERM